MANKFMANTLAAPEHEAAQPDALSHPRHLLWRVFQLGKLIAVVVVLYYVALVGAYRFVNPVGSNLILAHYVANGEVKHQWVGLDEVSRHVPRAVVMSEDARFCQHFGVDLIELRAAIMRADHRGVRGASTISMQTAKNLFLWSSRSYVRKAIELPLATLMDVAWPKRRMLEIYLNIAEWGPGVYGIEAAARHHFGKSARDLSAHEAALLAAALPNPKGRVAGRPGPKTRRIAGIVRKRMTAATSYTGCLGLT